MVEPGTRLVDVTAQLTAFFEGQTAAAWPVGAIPFPRTFCGTTLEPGLAFGLTLLPLGLPFGKSRMAFAPATLRRHRQSQRQKHKKDHLPAIDHRHLHVWQTTPIGAAPCHWRRWWHINRSLQAGRNSPPRLCNRL